MKTQNTLIGIVLIGLMFYGCVAPEQKYVRLHAEEINTTIEQNTTQTNSSTVEQAVKTLGPIMTVNSYIDAILNETPDAMLPLFSIDTLTYDTDFNALVMKERLTRGVVGFANVEITTVQKNESDAIVVACLGPNDEYPSTFALNYQFGAWLITRVILNDDATASVCYKGNMAPLIGSSDCEETIVINDAYVSSYEECDCLYETDNDGNVTKATNDTIINCKRKVAVRYLDTDGCASLGNQFVQNNCYQMMAMSSGNSTYCSFLTSMSNRTTDAEFRESCEGMVSKNKR